MSRRVSACREWLRRTLIRENAYRDFWLVVVTILLYITVTGQGDQVERIDQVSGDTAKLAKRTAKLTRAIQSQRVNSILTSCRDQNARHDNTLEKLDVLIGSLPPGPEKVRAVANKPSTVVLIDALVPKRRCRQVVREALTPAPRRQTRDLTPP